MLRVKLELRLIPQAQIVKIQILATFEKEFFLMLI